MMAKTSTPANDQATRKPERQEEAPKSAEEELDKALADSFPASDPPAPITKGTPSKPMPDEKVREAGTATFAPNRQAKKNSTGR